MKKDSLADKKNNRIPSVILICLLLACVPFLPAADRLPDPVEEIDVISTLEERIYLERGWYYRIGDSPQYSQPGFDDSEWKSVDFPYMRFPFDPVGDKHIWFRKYFFLTTDLAGMPLGYSAGKLPEAAEIYLNGFLVGRHGSMPPDHYFGNRTIPKSYLLSDGLLRYGQVNVIAIRAYTEMGDMNLVAPYLSREQDMMKPLSRVYIVNVTIPMLIIFVSAIVAVYFLLMFLRNKKEKFNIYIFITHICVCLFFTLLSFEYLPAELMLMTKIQYSTLFVACLFMIFYIQDFFGIHSLKRVKLIMGGCVVITLGVIYSAPTFKLTMFYIYVIFYLLVLIPCCLYLLMLTALAIKRKKRYAIELCVGISIMLLTVFHDIYFVSVARSEPSMWLFASGMVFFLVSLFVTAANRFLDAKKEVDQLNIELMQQKNAFFRFVPTQFLSLLGKNSAVDISLGDSSQRSMSVLFSDIRQFSSISRDMNPEASFRLLNRYLMRMESSILENDGFVDKYIGNAIMALFSEIPGSDVHRTSADRAVEAAIQMRQQLDEFNRQQKLQGSDVLNIGIGINTGPLLLGTVGSGRLDTTVIGDSVKLASRLERLTSFFMAGILISEHTLKLLSRVDELLYRKVDLITVKESKEAVAVYEVFNCDSSKVKERKFRTRDSLLEGITFYRAGEFEQALGIFREMGRLSPGDVVPLIFMKRCQTYLKTPPPGDWNGVYSFPECDLK